jgi:hypothetical protein
VRHLFTLCVFLAFFAGAAHGDAAPVLLFPGVTHAAGGGASGSTLVLNNATVTPQLILLELLPHGSAIASASRSVLLGPRERQEIADLHAFLGTAEGVGMLRVTGSVAATVRLRDQDDESVLKELPAVNPEQAIAPNEVVDFPFSTPAGIERDARSNLILVNLDARDVTVTLSLGLITARKTIPAGAFVQIDNLGGFLGTPAGIASAHAVADGRWFGTIMTVRPLATGQRRRAVGRPGKLLSSFGLIDEALAAGTINAEQALTYKIFADFGDSRLPAAFRGDDSGVITVDSPGLAARQWATLSPVTRDLIGPYLVPAFYEGSWWSLRRAGATSIRPLAGCKPWEIDTCSILTDWLYVAGNHVRVWYEKDRDEDFRVAADLVREVDAKIWPELFKVMGRYPILDHEMNGTKLLDIVIADNMAPGVLATTFPLAFGCMRGPTYVVINRNYPSIDELHSAFAHELFHSVQHTYNTEKCFEVNYAWLMESTATWFEDELYPHVNREHSFAKDYLDKTELSLGTDIGLEGRAKKGHWYGAYTFFFYLTRIGGADPNTLVRNVWEATEKADALHALDAGLKKSGVPLEKSWPEFAVYSWNEEAPFNRYDTDDKLKHKAKLEISGNLTVPAGDKRFELGDNKLSLPYLSMRYFRLDFPDAAVSTVAFYNGIQRALDEKPVTWLADFGNVLTARKVSDPASIKGAHVDALLKVDGKWTRADEAADKADVWNDKPFKTLCRDLKKERIESMVIILSNSDIESTLQPQGKFPPIVQATNIGCYAWEGSADLTNNDGNGRIEKMTVSNLRLEARGDVPDDEDTPLRRLFTVVAGTFRWSISGASGGCTFSAPVVDESLGQGNLLYTFPYAKTPAAGARGVLPVLFQEWNQVRLIVAQGQPCGGFDNWKASSFFLVLEPNESHAQVSSAGKSYTLDASKIFAGGDVTGTWRFTAKRE